MARAPEVRAVVVYSPGPREVREWRVVLPRGATVSQALLACGLQRDFPELDLRSAALGVWGRKAAPTRALRDLDRVEVYRPLRVDPKRARRERFNKQGSRAAGLFARRKSGAAGY